MSNPNRPPTDRRTVKGLAHKPCEFCAREREDRDGKPYNYQYLTVATDQWDSHIFCSKVCYNAWHTMNG